MRLLTKPFFLIVLLFAVGLSACNMPAGTPDAAATIQAIYTAQAATVQVLPTQVVTVTPNSFPTVAFPTIPPQTAVATATTAAQQPPTQTAVTYCDAAAFVKDITIPDGTVMTPATKFSKVWRLQNIGTCSWTSSYSLVFSNGNQMSGPVTVPLAGNVNPGQTVDISVNLTAPSSEGAYRGYWMLRNAAGVVFGVGGGAKNPFYVDIKVVGGMTTVFDFAKSYCFADWRSGAGDLGCPGNVNGKKGYVIQIENPTLENGQVYKGLGMMTVPERINEGYLRGYYQPFTVQNGDRFRAIINCEYPVKGCNVMFRLEYQLDSKDDPKTVWQFVEVYEGQYYNVDVDLSPLAGKQVVFILAALANGVSEFDKPLWVAPRIDRPSNLVTPSATPTVTPTVTTTATLPVTNTATPTTTATATVTATGTATVTPTATNTNVP